MPIFQIDSFRNPSVGHHCDAEAIKTNKNRWYWSSEGDL